MNKDDVLDLLSYIRSGVSSIVQCDYVESMVEENSEQYWLNMSSADILKDFDQWLSLLLVL